MKIIPFQPTIRPALPAPNGPQEFLEQCDYFERISNILTTSGLEREFIKLAAIEHKIEDKKLSHKELENFSANAILALRSNIARAIKQLDHREFCCLVADSYILQKFLLIREIDGKVNIFSKSTSQRHSVFVNPDTLRLINDKFHALLNTPVVAASCGLSAPIAYNDIFMDATCLMCNIHHPVDWILLRDAVRTLAKSVANIRKHGLKCRLPKAPLTFLSDMNKLCINMSAVGRTKDRKKLTKKALREMKHLVNCVARHANSHLKALRTRLAETDLTQADARVIITRMENILSKLPAVIRQAHERIIGGRKVANADKILSLYEEEVRVILRGKAGAAVEFGNILWLAETRQGLIVDYKLLKKNPSEPSLFIPSVKRLVDTMKLRVEAIFTDRGPATKANHKFLKKKGIKSGLCPRSVHELAEQLKTDPEFRAGQKRRASTEARISIFKNQYCGKPMRAKGFKHREQTVGWAVLAHNLWQVARLARAALKDVEEVKSA